MSYELDADTVVQFEIEPMDEWQQVSADQVVSRVEEASRPAVEAARRVMTQIAALCPAEVEVTFGIKVSGTANWLVAKAASEANFGVKIVWRPGTGTGGDGDEGNTAA
ncbi:CU044_2847 family protein [Kitasatospora purpeofusca]|uniref:CU044_2847 family protein n=1 Tax=Kitasatospora purpeofusca TaxID=67352 RepID=UPI003F4AE7C4